MKQAHERSIFRSFARAAGLSINSRSVRSLEPPRPDISCRLDGIPQYFELTRMAHKKIANSIGHHLHQLKYDSSTPSMDAFIYDDRSALRLTIKRKANKLYETSGRPVSLLIYLDGVYHPPSPSIPGAAGILCEEGPNYHWEGIWLYNAAYNCVLANWIRKGFSDRNRIILDAKE